MRTITVLDVDDAPVAAATWDGATMTLEADPALAEQWFEAGVGGRDGRPHWPDEGNVFLDALLWEYKNPYARAVEDTADQPVRDEPPIEARARLTTRRAPTAYEQRVLALTAMPAFLDEQIAALTATITGVREDQLRRMASVIARRDASTTTSEFTDIRPDQIALPYVTDVTRAIRRVQDAVATYGARQVDAELDRQGVPIAMAARKRSPSTAKAARSALVSSARTSAEALSDAWYAAVLESAARHRRSGRRGKKLAASIIADMLDRAKSGVSRPARKRVHEAFALGRATGASRRSDVIGRVEFSAVMDEHTCDACASADGTRVAYDSPEYHAMMPPYHDCAGEDNCRCVWIYGPGETQLRAAGFDDVLALYRPDQERHAKGVKVEGAIGGGRFKRLAGRSAALVAKFRERFAGTFKFGVELGEQVPQDEGAWEDDQNLKAGVYSKQDGGDMAEAIGAAWLRQVRGHDAIKSNANPEDFSRSVNINKPSPVDVIWDERLTDIKGGSIGNQPKSRQSRLTENIPQKLLEGLTGAQREAEIDAWQAKLWKRKLALQGKVNKQLGANYKLTSIMVIMNPTRGVADIYEFDSVHSRVQWDAHVRGPREGGAHRKELMPSTSLPEGGRGPAYRGSFRYTVTRHPKQIGKRRIRSPKDLIQKATPPKKGA